MLCLLPRTSAHAAGNRCATSLVDPCVQVTTEHVLLGLVAEETGSKNGFLNSGLTVEKTRAAVESLSGKRKPNSTHDNIPFSREVRKTFEAATNVSPSLADVLFGSAYCNAHACISKTRQDEIPAPAARPLGV